MTILVIGGTGKLGFAVAKALQSSYHQSVLLTSRRAKSINSSPSSPYKNFHVVHFNWYDKSTFKNPFEYAYQHRPQHSNFSPTSTHAHEYNSRMGPIDRVFLIAPISVNMLEHMKPFIELAIREGVQRIVFVSATPVRKGDPGPGKVHEYIANRGIDWCVLRPSWYMETFATNYLLAIRDHDTIPSIAQNGAVPFISISDIVKPACAALMDKRSPNKEHKIVGPDLLTYDQAANIFSHVLGRPIKHKRMSPQDHAMLYQKAGMGKEDAELLTRYECDVALGVDEAIWEEEDKIVGKKCLGEFVRTHRKLWERLKEPGHSTVPIN